MVKNLKYLRTRYGISQQQLAEIAGVSQQSVNKYENHNIEPDIRTLTAFADFFHTSVDFLIGHTEVEHRIEHVQQYDLNRDEARLLQAYRLLTPEEQESIHLIMGNYNKRDEAQPALPRWHGRSVMEPHHLPAASDSTIPGSRPPGGGMRMGKIRWFICTEGSKA